MLGLSVLGLVHLQPAFVDVGILQRNVARVNQRAKVSRFSGKTASKKDHPDVLNLPVLTGATWSDLRGNPRQDSPSLFRQR